ncbi:hypothetical protein [Pseudomonas cerasi]
MKQQLRILPALRAFFTGLYFRGEATGALPLKNAIQAAKNEFSKVKYLKNLFQYYTVSTRITFLPGKAAV